MEWLWVIGFILFGIGLIVIEVIFVPGTTIVGIGGLLCTAYGIYLSYDYFGSTTGNITLVITGLICLIGLIYALKTNAWSRFSLKDTNLGKVNDDYKFILEPGTEGQAISDIKPIGKALLDENEVEVRSLGGFIEAGKKIRIVRIENTRIFVEPLNEI